MREKHYSKLWEKSARQQDPLPWEQLQVAPGPRTSASTRLEYLKVLLRLAILNTPFEKQRTILYLGAILDDPHKMRTLIFLTFDVS